MQALQPASSLLCTAAGKSQMKITRGDFLHQLFGFLRPQATRLLPYRASIKTASTKTALTKTIGSGRLLQPAKHESLPSTVPPSYSVRNRTSMTPSRPIVAVSK
jgi:hypothetical protein